jgi:hypothetical protein
MTTHANVSRPPSSLLRLAGAANIAASTRWVSRDAEQQRSSASDHPLREHNRWNLLQWLRRARRH